MKTILLAPILSLAFVGGCTVDSAGRKAAEVAEPSAQTQGEQSAVQSNSEAARAALLADDGYRATRAESSSAYADFDKKLASKLALNPTETGTFLAILDENNRERLRVMDYVRHNQGIPRAEVLAGLKASANIANPAKIQHRLRALLGGSRYEHYLQLLRNRDEWYR